MAAGEEEENARLELLLKMAGKRKDISTPDVDAAWEDFRARHVGGMRREPREPRRMRPWVAALWGAAAMWCAVMLYEWMEPLWLNPDSGDPFVALRYEQAPRRVVLDNGGGTSQQKNKLTEIYKKLQATTDAIQNYHYDDLFHGEIMAMANNSRLADAMSAYIRMFDGAIKSYFAAGGEQAAALPQMEKSYRNYIQSTPLLL